MENFETIYENLNKAYELIKDKEKFKSLLNKTIEFNSQFDNIELLAIIMYTTEAVTQMMGEQESMSMLGAFLQSVYSEKELQEKTVAQLLDGLYYADNNDLNAAVKSYLALQAIVYDEYQNKRGKK